MIKISCLDMLGIFDSLPGKWLLYRGWFPFGTSPIRVYFLPTKREKSITSAYSTQLLLVKVSLSRLVSFAQ